MLNNRVVVTGLKVTVCKINVLIRFTNLLFNSCLINRIILSNNQRVFLQKVKDPVEIFNYNDYRAFMNSYSLKTAERGWRSRLAQAAGASPSWMTRALSGTVQITPDQAMGIAGFLQLNETETDYFLLLVDLDRAATQLLKKRIQKKLEALKKESRKITASIKYETTVFEKHATKYYSSWIYSAVHVFCMVKPQSTDEITQNLLLSNQVVKKTLHELREMGLVEIVDLLWQATSHSIHLSADHPSAKSAHTIWRNKTIQFLHEGHDDGLHYSAIHCLSKEDIEKIYLTLKNTIVNCRKTIADSPSEKLAIFCLDWYSL